jgi:hypothetical protein
MADLADTHLELLPELKKHVENSFKYFESNVERFEKFMKFIFKSSMTDGEISALKALGKPPLEFNILEAYISRQRGEFAKQQPNLSVRVADGVPSSMLTPQLIQKIQIIEAHLKAIFFGGTNDMLDYNIFTETTGGGFSVANVFTKYINEMSFEQKICVEKVFDPTLTGFDPLARESHKGDGRYAFEIYPMTKESFEEEFGKSEADQMTYTSNLSSFNWSFKNGDQKIILVCNLYLKKTRKKNIVKLSNGHSMTDKKYEEFLKRWEKDGRIEQPPVITKTRKTLIEYIVRYQFCEKKVLSFVETNFKYLPLVFFDGNSVYIKEDGSSSTQMTRPSVYQAEGIQKLKNFAGQSVANEIENSVQHKVMAPLEGIPDDPIYQKGYTDFQQGVTLVYNCFDKKNPAIALPPPQMIARTPIPPEFMNTFVGSDQMAQTILGNYDAAAGANRADMSGISFARSALQSNTTAMPYIVGYIKGINRVGQIILDLIPKYYKTPMSIPVLMPDGKRSHVKINTEDSMMMDFDPNHIEIQVEAGVNFAMQKEIALQTLTALQQSNPGFAQFMAEEGLPVILDNIEIRGIDQIKEKANAWSQRQKTQQAQQMQMAQQQQQSQMQQQQQEAQIQMKKQQMEMAMMQKEIQSPSQTQIEQMFIQQKSQTDAANLAIKAQDSETKFLETLSKIKNADIENELKASEIQAEKERTAVDSAINLSKHLIETIEKGSSHDRQEK